MQNRANTIFIIALALVSAVFTSVPYYIKYQEEKKIAYEKEQAIVQFQELSNYKLVELNLEEQEFIHKTVDRYNIECVFSVNSLNYDFCNQMFDIVENYNQSQNNKQIGRVSD